MDVFDFVDRRYIHFTDSDPERADTRHIDSVEPQYAVDEIAEAALKPVGFK